MTLVIYYQNYGNHNISNIDITINNNHHDDDTDILSVI